MPFPKVEVSAVAIVRGGRILAVYNAAWGAFTLPMTKRRVMQDKKIETVHRDESWEHAASRAIAENIGKTVVGLKPLVSLLGFQQSDRDGAIKEYDYQAFRFDLPDGIEPIAGLITEWLTIEEWLDPRRAPISPTAVNLLKQAEGESNLGGQSFP